jgi:hypothetical protein
VAEGWLEHPEVTSTHDVSFLRDWLACDHWAWDASDPFRAPFAAHPEQAPLAAPIPSYVPLQTVAKVTLAQGFAGETRATCALDVPLRLQMVYLSPQWHLCGPRSAAPWLQTASF